jgi:hypothetical protein
MVQGEAMLLRDYGAVTSEHTVYERTIIVGFVFQSVRGGECYGVGTDCVVASACDVQGQWRLSS